MDANERKSGLPALLALAILGIVMPTVTAQPAPVAGHPLVFVSSFAAAPEGGVQAFHLDVDTGKLAPAHRTPVANPFFIALSPSGRFLYSIDARQFGGAENEQVAAYAIEDREGALRLLNRQSTRGTSSCYLDVDATGKALLLANYGTGSVAAYPVKKDGSLGAAASFMQHAGSSVDASRQEGPHAHSFILSPDNRHCYSADLGLDQVLAYRLAAATAALTPARQPFVRTPPGVGPRHLAFHPNGRHLYAINELANSVTVFHCDPKTGILVEQQTISTVPADVARGKSYCADVKVTPDGRFLYGTNRGHDSIACYRIGEDGRLTLIAIEPSLGKGPQNLLITPEELVLCANMPGDNVAVFRIDRESGRLEAVGMPVAIKSPSCIRLLPFPNH